MTNNIVIFLKLLPGQFEEAEFMIPARSIQLQCTAGKVSGVGLTSHIQKVKWTWAADFVDFSVVRSKSAGLLPLTTLEGTRLRGPSHDYRSLDQADVTKFDTDVLRRVAGNAVWRRAVCL